jgi:hypothetical protein
MLKARGLISELSVLLVETWQFFISNLVGICSVLIPIVLPLTVLSAFLIEDDTTILGSLIDLAFYPIYQGAVILYIASVVADEKLTLKQYYCVAARSWLALIILYIFTSLAFVLGILLFVIPGFIVFGRLAFAEFHCLLENRGGTESFLLSWETTKPVQAVLIVGLSIIVIGIVGLGILVELLLSEFGVWNGYFSIIVDVLFSVACVLIPAFAFRVYQLEAEKHQQVTD